jgi:hypothetical protein
MLFRAIFAYTREHAYGRDFVSMYLRLYALLKGVCKVLGCDSNIKWSIGAITGVGSHG